ncbi:MAG: hypothetical protein VX812_04900 [Pseudomonadota bacterium]|nr:hypothetical protein [Pseudomonadota bacterium]
MKKIILFINVFMFLTFSSHLAYADDHSQELPNVSNIQVNVCKLNDGVTLDQYNLVTNDYIKWSKKNNVETFYVRHFPLFSHASTGNPPTFDFLEILGSSHETSGKAWDLWLNTKEGQKLNARWQEVADCYPKMGTGVTLWSDQKALANADKRVVTWNWCSLNDGVSAEEIVAKHTDMAKNLEGNDQGIIGWAGIIPRLGRASAPGDFTHIIIFPDIKAAMKHQKTIAQGGWKHYRDYEKHYASCTGEELYNVEVLNRLPQ